MNAITFIRRPGLAQAHSTAAERDRQFYLDRHLAWNRDRHDFVPQWLMRWQLRAQVYAAVVGFRGGIAPHPGDLSTHRIRHSDSIRRMRIGSVSSHGGPSVSEHTTDFPDAQIPAPWRRPVCARTQREAA